MKRTAVVLATDRATRLFLSSTLNSRRWWVGEASSPAGAYALVTTFRVDVILIDLRLMDWWEVLDLCRCSRKLQQEANTRIVVLASEDASTTICTEFRRFVDRVYRRPFTSRAVRDWLSATLPNG